MFKRSVIGLIGAALFASANVSMADPIAGSNPRPVPIVVGGEQTLQSFLNSISPGYFNVNAGPTNAGGQQDAALFMHTDINSPVVTAMRLELAGNANANTFGMWSDADRDTSTTGDRTFAQIFSGPAAVGYKALLTWSDFDTLSVIILNASNALVGFNTYDGININAFGFYIGTAGGTFYSADQLNPNGTAMMLAFNKQPENRWYLAWEDTLPGDRDFNDMVVSIESIVKVPEPGSIALLGLGLAVLAGVGRRKVAS